MSAAVCCCEWNCGAIRRCSVLCEMSWTACGDTGIFRAGMPCRSSRRRRALTNIIRHAYLGDAERPIEVSCAGFMCRGMAGAVMLLKSPGRSRVTVNAKKMCGRALEDVRPGAGPGLIRESMIRVEFSRRKCRISSAW